VYAYFIDISQSSAEMHLRYGGICYNHVIANCLQSVPVKEFWKSINNWRRLDKSSGMFFWPTLYVCVCFSDLAEQYTQCTLMSFMPPFTGTFIQLKHCLLLCCYCSLLFYSIGVWVSGFQYLCI